MATVAYAAQPVSVSVSPTNPKVGTNGTVQLSAIVNNVVFTLLGAPDQTHLLAGDGAMFFGDVPMRSSRLSAMLRSAMPAGLLG